MTLLARDVTVRAQAARPALRLGFLDALRGVAVGLVLVEHIGEQLMPGMRALATSGVQLGQLGVMVFFLCSGFIVPASLERGGGSRAARVRRFWRGRFFRLYPMYWLSLAAALVLAIAGRYSAASGVGLRAWVVNATMTQGVIGQPNVIGVYWSLAFELLFYLAVSALCLAGLHRRSVALSLTASGLCLVLAAAARPALDRHVPLGVFCLVTMFAGTVVHRWHAGTVRFRTAVLCGIAALGSGTALLAAVLLGHDDPAALGTRTFGPMLAAWVGAYAVFGLGLALRHRRPPGWLVRLGVVSYAVYLLHPLVLAAVPRVGGAVGTAVLWTGLTLVLSEGCHRYVEKPAIRLGRRRPASATQDPHVQFEIVPLAETLRRRAHAAWRLVVTEISGFGVVGGLAFLVDLGVFQLIYVHTDAGAVLAKLASTIVSSTVAYVGHRYWSFSHRARTGVRREYVIFTIINAITLLISLGIVAFVRHGLDQSSALVLQMANVGSIAVTTVIRYLAYRQWVFPAPEPASSRAVSPVTPAGESRAAA